MKDAIEVRWHGRGGQGAKTAAQFLAEAALDAGKFIQAFPEYGPERAGAPMKAFTRISDKPVTVHSGVKNPDAVVVIDPTLINPEVLEGLADTGVVVLNSEKTPEDMRKRLNFTKGKVATVDATKISLEVLGLPMPNTPMIGALLKTVAIVSMDSVKEQVKKKFLKKLGEEKTAANIRAIEKAYQEVKIG